MESESEDLIDIFSQPSKRRRSAFNFNDEYAIDAEADEVEEEQEDDVEEFQEYISSEQEEVEEQSEEGEEQAEQGERDEQDEQPLQEADPGVIPTAAASIQNCTKTTQRSWLWQHFSLEGEKDKRVAKCNYCAFAIAHLPGTSTANIQFHVIRKHHKNKQGKSANLSTADNDDRLDEEYQERK